MIPSYIDEIPETIRLICKARVTRVGEANRRPWWYEAELVQAILEDIERAGFVLVRRSEQHQQERAA